MGLKPAELEQQLKTRKWPDEVRGVIIGDYDNSPYVREGRVFSRALRMHQQVSEPIPAGESAVTSLCRGTSGRIYGATSGTKSHLFFYDPSPVGDGVVDIGAIDGVRAVRRCLVSAHDQRIFFAASEVDGKADGKLYVYDTSADYSDEFRIAKSKIQPLATPVKGECIAALCCDLVRKVIYGVSQRTGTLFAYDYHANKTTRFGQVSKDAAFSRCLVIDSAGNVFGTHSLGTLFRFSPEKQQVEDLGIRIPSVAGRDFYNQLDSAVYDPLSGLIYAGGTADGVLFSLNPETLEMRSIGKVIAEPRVRAIAAAPDGRIFGVSGYEDGMGHLFCYDPVRHELKDLGIMIAASEVWRRGFEIDAACTGLNGEIYFGENERDGHLFMYFPAPARSVWG